MQVPLQIAFENMDASEAVEQRIRDEVGKLEQFYERITAARVVIARPQRRHHKGDTFQIRIHLTVPGAADIAISRDPGDMGAHEDVYVTIRDAFGAARRQLQDLARKRQGNVKAHETAPHGRISAVHPERDHGFISTADGREVYFHRNSLTGATLETLEVGQEVRFSETVGDKGPQATMVRPVGKHHLD